MAHIKEGSLIISCQAVKGEPLYGYNIMHLMAKAAKEGSGFADNRHHKGGLSK